MPSASKISCRQMGFLVAASNIGPITLSKVWLVYRFNVHLAFLYTRQRPKPIMKPKWVWEPRTVENDEKTQICVIQQPTPTLFPPPLILPPPLKKTPQTALNLDNLGVAKPNNNLLTWRTGSGRLPYLPSVNTGISTTIFGMEYLYFITLKEGERNASVTVILLEHRATECENWKGP